MHSNLPTRNEMIRALATWHAGERAYKDALHAGRYDDLPVLSDQATEDYKHLMLLIDRLPEGVRS